MSVKTEKVVVEEVKETYTCDICGKEMQHRRCCIVCKRDICNKCRVSDYGEWKGIDYGDHPKNYCKPCWEIGEPFREEYRKLNERHYVEEDAIIDKWHKKAKEHV